jgi:hypothetical protein
MISGLYGLLTVLALAVMLVFAVVATVYVRRLEARDTFPLSEEVGGTTTVVAKVRKREPLSNDELAFAKQVVADRTSVRALAIPAMIFALGCFYVLGSLQHLHGATPSERTFLGVIPMFTSTNLAIRMISHARLKGRLKRLGSPEPSPAGNLP